MAYKESFYNVYLNYNDVQLVFNGVTSAFAEIEDDYLEIIKSVNNHEEIDEKDEVVAQMIENGFLVNSMLNETKLLKLGNYSSKFNSDSIGLTIAPTLACNFACPYCYENEKKEFMDKNTQKSIVDFVEKMAKLKKNVSITWYGGEPILAKDIIKKLSEEFIKICKSYDVSYGAYIVSNGYLITQEVAKELKEEKIRGIQLTIDGPPSIHNQRRKLKTKEEDTFYKIIESAKILKSNDIKVHIRVNIDKSNKDYFKELLDILKENNLNDCSVNLGHVKAYTNACLSIADSCIKNEEFALYSIECQKIMKEKGFDTTDYPYYPYVKGNYCCADSLSAYVIDPQGYMYKCWNDIGNIEKSVGNITSIDKVTSKNEIVNLEYLMWSPFEFEECIKCKILPICMGGCPYSAMKSNNKPECENWKYNLEQTLIEVYKSS